MKNLKSKLTNINPDTEAIILLHGLTGTIRRMNEVGKRLAAYGYKTINADYPCAKE